MAEPDWDALTQETVQNLSRLLQAETVNPPGNEELAVKVLEEILDREGFPRRDITIVESVPHRPNLVARIHGDGSRQPMLLSGHTDVVPVEREFWTHDPFGGEVIDGEIWGRGALDMKGTFAMYLSTFLAVHRLKLPLKRDLILAAVADEEAGFEHGSKFLVDQHPDLIKAEYGITEAGAVSTYFGTTRLYPIQVAERGVCWLKMTAHGQSGHASMPHADNAIHHLSEAIDKLRRAGHLPVHLSKTFLRMLNAAGRQLKFPLSLATGLMRSPGLVSFFLDRLPETNRGLFASMISNSVALTKLQAGVETTVIPTEAEATLGCHKLPGQSTDDLKKEILAITGDRVTLELIQEGSGTEFPVDSPFYRTLEAAARRMDPEGVFVPMLMPGATDAGHYRRIGNQMYGYTPGILPPDFPTLKIGHGHDERLPISFIRSGLPVLWQVVSETCG